jgi:hypothetical protein
MSSSPTLSREVRALLDRERGILPVPDAARARSLARARAALIAGGVPTSASSGVAGRTRWIALAVGMCMLAAAVGAAAYEIRARFGRPSGDPAPSIVVVLAAPPTPPMAPASAEAAPGEPLSSAAGASAPAPRQPDDAGSELRLMEHARAAVVRGNFAAALPLIAEHSRRFKGGRLAEEREALRVKALSGLGRAEEARRAADAFKAHFPKSVLLPAVSQMPASGP